MSYLDVSKMDEEDEEVRIIFNKCNRALNDRLMSMS
jgi:hypothetical protein